PPAAKELLKLQQLIRESVEQSRNLAKLFYPIELEKLGLLAALQEISRKTNQFTDITYVVEANEDPSCANLRGQPAIQLFRIVQESVHNALSHGQAKRISVRLASSEDTITLTVKDDGSGLPPNHGDAKGMGSHIM